MTGGGGGGGGSSATTPPAVVGGGDPASDTVGAGDTPCSRGSVSTALPSTAARARCGAEGLHQLALPASHVAPSDTSFLQRW